MSTTGSKHPRAFIHDDDGDVLRGRYKRFGIGRTSQGDAPLVVLEEFTSGELLSYFLFATVVYSAFEREITARPKHDLEPGELVTIERLGTRESRNGYRYTDFAVTFEHEHKPTPADIFAARRGEHSDAVELPSHMPEVFTAAEDVDDATPPF